MKKYCGFLLVLLLLSSDLTAQSRPQPAAPVQTVTEYVDRVQERSFRGCEISSSVLEGSGNTGRTAAGRSSDRNRNLRGRSQQ